MNRDIFLSSITVIDTETTNSQPELAEIVEIAAANYTGQTWNVNGMLLGVDGGIPPDASARNNISNRMIDNLPNFANAVEDVNGVLQLATTTYFVAHNSRYDQLVLAKSWNGAGHTDLSSVAENTDNWICTQRLTRHLLSQSYPDLQYDLNYLRYKFDLPVADDIRVHRAGGDALICAVLFEFLVDYALAVGVVSDEPDLGNQLHKLCWQPIIYTTWPFGKHKGVSFGKIPDDYYLWALQNLDALTDGHANFNMDLSESVRLELECRLDC